MENHNVEEMNDDRNTGANDSHTENDESSSLNLEKKPQNCLEVISNAQGDIDNISGSLVGRKSENLEDIMKLYSDHSKAVGFSVRKSNTRYNVVGLLISKVMVCSCEGLRKNTTFASSSNMNNSKKRNVQITRTDCKALFRIKWNGIDNLYEVKEHILEHNHPLCRPELSYMLRSNRKITDENAVVIEDLISSGIRATDAYRYMAQQAGGENMVGYTQRDHINFVNRLKILAIEGGDAQTLLSMLQDKSTEHDDFFFRVRLDDDGKLCHVFWRDSLMKDDYIIFGDVMIFNTTYRTNKYNLICAPFVGLDNNRRNVMFGCAFLSNEKIETFEWLFQTFKKCMGGRSPISLFTDQDLAMSKAIENVFPQTRHRLCIWHLYQNAQAHLGKLKSNKTFADAFQKCITGCTDTHDFEEHWKDMIEKYDLKNNSWIKRLYELREKWSNAFNKEFFSAGVLSSQRSESTNHALGFRAKKTTNLVEFYGLFEQTIQHWRSTQLIDEFECSKGQPLSSFHMGGIVKHASEGIELIFN